jgi:HEAT repeat protein
MQEILPRKTMIIHLKLGIHKFLLTILCLILVAGCARFSQYELEDVEKQRLKFKNGDEKALWLLSDIYKDNSQSYEVRLAALRALSESRHPLIIFDIQSSVKNSSLVELDLMKEAILMLVSYKEITSIDSLIEALYTTEEKTLEIRTSILNAVGSYGTIDEIQLILKLYDFGKRSNAQMNSLLTTKLGEIGDNTVIPILMEIAKNKTLSVDIRNRAVEVLSKKQAPELVDFFVEMLGDPVTRDKVNEYAFDVMGEIPEERMLLALLESYQIGRHKYYALLNTVMNNLDNYDNPEIKSVYLEIAQTSDFPSNIRLKAFKGLTRYSDPEVIEGVVELLNNPDNYIYYNEIIGMLHEFEVYDIYEDKLRVAAFNAMKKEVGYIGQIND